MTKKGENAPVSVRLTTAQRKALQGVAADLYGGNLTRAVVEALQAVYGPILKATLADLGPGAQADRLKVVLAVLEETLVLLDGQAAKRDQLKKRQAEVKKLLDAALSEVKA